MNDPLILEKVPMVDRPIGYLDFNVNVVSI